MIYVTGDIHGDISRFSDWNLENEEVALDDNVLFIVCGNFGIPFGGEYTEEDKRLIDCLSNTPYTFCFVDGCHDNHDILTRLPEAVWQGGKVGVISDNIIYLKRGELYDIEGNKVLVMGGGISLDKEERIKLGKYWWPQEEPNDQEWVNMVYHALKCDNNIDYVITHTPPVPFDICHNSVSEKMNQIMQSLKYKMWYCGYLHHDSLYPVDKLRCLHRKIVKLGQ